MEYLREITDRFSIAGSPRAVEDFESLRAFGYAAVVNLRGSDEIEPGLKPEHERTAAAKAGMLYAHIPVAADSLNDAVVDEFREWVSGVRGRILVHSGTGERSAALAIMHVASEKGLSGQEAIEQARRTGVLKDDSLAQLVERYVDQHSVDIHTV